MVAADRDALLCDLAETYRIYDFRALPVSTLATLAVGLRENSRIKMHLSGMRITREEMLLAAAVDRLSLLLWAKTEDGRNGINRPKSVLSTIMGDDSSNGPVEAYESAEDFEAEWFRITGGHHGR